MGVISKQELENMVREIASREVAAFRAELERVNRKYTGPGQVLGNIINGSARAVPADGGFVGAIRKALGTGSVAAGGALVSEQLSADVIEAVRGRSVVRRLPGVQVVGPLEGTGPLVLPKVTQGSAVSWVAENTDIAETTVEFGQITLSPKMAAAILPVSNQLLQDGGPNAEAIIQNDIVNALAEGEDSAFLRGDGTANQPKGLRYWAASEAVTAVNAAVTYDALVDALVAVQARNFEPRAWIANPRFKAAVLKLKDANGAPILVQSMQDITGAPRDLLLGLPIFYTTHIPANLGVGGNETEVYVVDSSQIVIADWQPLEVAASQEASYITGGQLVSAFSRNQTVLRVLARTDIALRHDGAVQVLTGVQL